MKTLRVTCNPSLRIPLDELHELQGDLKEMTTERYEKFKKLVLKKGIWFAMHVWGGRMDESEAFGKRSEGKWFIEDGHGRRRMFVKLRSEGIGIPPIPCVEIYAKDFKEAHEAILAASSNFQRATEEGLYEFAQAAGFTIDELDDYDLPDIDLPKFRAGYYEEPADEEEPPTPAPPVVPKSQLGELWKLGQHRLLCGDSTDGLVVGRIMAFGSERADLVFTDPPYNLGSETNLLGAGVSQAFQGLKDAKWDRNFDVTRIFPGLLAVMAESCSVYVCTSQFLAGEIWKWMAEWAEYPGWCVWSKPNPMPSLAKRSWTSSAELICYAHRGKHVFNFPEQGHAPNVWTINKSAKNDLHPTQKPVAVPEHAIRHSSRPGQLVLDLFGGSGCTLMACQRLDRKARIVELDPRYVDVMLTRWAEETGEDPVREDGIKWSALSNEALGEKAPKPTKEKSPASEKKAGPKSGK